ncbi:hypothetical protein [Methylobacterium sp. WL116]|uniref:hypothetical protein n=1 Tax=Methylobacterium sp. WL116 TaxID=2603889 RepID=UPI001AEF2508|nr:hypothetical protein [Methylobacterium sp. WL116]
MGILAPLDVVIPWQVGGNCLTAGHVAALGPCDGVRLVEAPRLIMLPARALLCMAALLLFPVAEALGSRPSPGAAMLAVFAPSKRPSVRVAPRMSLFMNRAFHSVMPSNLNTDRVAKFLRERALGVFSRFYDDTRSASVLSAKL